MKLIADNHTLSICDATTGHAVRPIAFFDTAAHCRQVIARQERMEEALRRVRSSIDVSLGRALWPKNSSLKSASTPSTCCAATTGFSFSSITTIANWRKS